MIISTPNLSSTRQQKIVAGLQELELWLYDLIRGGIAQVQYKPVDYWKEAASRLVDAQAASLARQLRSLSAIPGSSADWPERLLLELSELHLLVQAYKQFDSLEPGMKADAKWAIGWTATPHALQSRPTVADRWLVLGLRQEKRERLYLRSTYLLGESTGRLALLLEHKQGRSRFDKTYLVGTALQAELIFCPSNAPLRAVVHKLQGVEPAGTLQSDLGEPDLRSALARFGTALTRNPWQHQYGLLLNNIVFVRRDNDWYLADNRGEWLGVDARFSEGWRLMAFSGGHPVTMAVEWNGDLLWPLSAYNNGHWVDLQSKKVRS